MSETDKHGNVKCARCGEFSSPSFITCPKCCKHDELRLVEEWQGPDDGGGWGLTVECAVCGKNYGWDNDSLIRHYKLVPR